MTKIPVIISTKLGLAGWEFFSVGDFILRKFALDKFLMLKNIVEYSVKSAAKIKIFWLQASQFLRGLTHIKQRIIVARVALPAKNYRVM